MAVCGEGAGREARNADWWARGVFHRARRGGLRCGRIVLLAAGLAGSVAQPLEARVLQCVPYAREVSGIAIHGDAHLWWDRAEGRYARGQAPQVGAVLVFRSTRAMPRGHVAVVREILDPRRIMLDHANWSGPGRIERGALAEDVSPAGDWSAVRVWFAPIDALGGRENPVYGFIYNAPPEPAGVREVPGQLALTGRQFLPAGGGAGR